MQWRNAHTPQRFGRAMCNGFTSSAARSTAHCTELGAVNRACKENKGEEMQQEGEEQEIGRIDIVSIATGGVYCRRNARSREKESPIPTTKEETNVNEIRPKTSRR